MRAPWPGERVVVATSSDDSPDASSESSKPWSFRPILKQQPPKVHSEDWLRSPIDNFILAGLDDAGLAPAPAAEKQTLLRRVYYALIGLPPTPDELNEFLADDAPDAYENAVERLLGRGYRSIKVKVGRQSLEQDISRVHTLKQHVAGRALLRLDGNRAWSTQAACRFGAAVGPEGIDYIEEPLRDPGDHTRFWKQTGIRVGLDETLVESPASEVS